MKNYIRMSFVGIALGFIIPIAAMSQAYIPHYKAAWQHVSSNIDLLWEDDLGFNLEGTGVTIGQVESLWLEHNHFKDPDSGLSRVSSNCDSIIDSHGTRGAGRAIGQREGIFVDAAGTSPRANLHGCSRNSSHYGNLKILTSSDAGLGQLNVASEDFPNMTIVQAVGNGIKKNPGRLPAENWYSLGLLGSIDFKYDTNPSTGEITITPYNGHFKNIISVGGAFGIDDGVARPVDQYNIPGRYDGSQKMETLNFFTSQGPTTLPYQSGDSGPTFHSQGRIKPDLVIANRADLHTQASTPTQTGGFDCPANIIPPDTKEAQTWFNHIWVPGMLRNTDPYNQATSLGFIPYPSSCQKERDGRGGTGIRTANARQPSGNPPPPPDPNLLASMNGSSSAAPATAGVVALLEELRIRYNHNPYLSTTMKAMLIHSAFEMGPWDGPDYKQGWGMVNAAGAAHLVNLGDVTSFDQSEQSSGGEVVEGDLTSVSIDTYSVSHDGNGPLKATLVWLDPITDIDLVNDLNVEIIRDSDGTKYQAWVLDPMNPSAPPTKGHNTTDNVEQVYLSPSQTTAGNYTVKVFGSGSFTNQSYSLVVTTYDTADPCGPNWNLDNLTYNDRRVYRAPNYITSANTLVDTNGNPEVTFHAGDEVVLEPGFEAKDNFEAGIRQCVIPSGYAFKTSGVVAQNVTPTIQDADIAGSYNFSLEPNYPNPFTDVTTISYSLAVADQVTLELFDMTGRLIKVIENEFKESGKYQKQLDLGSLPSGSYIYSLRTGDQVAHRSMTIIK